MISLPHNIIDDIKTAYTQAYKSTNITLAAEIPERLDVAALAGRDDMEIFVSPTASGCSLLALFDNLGKGAAGNAVANLNLMLNLEQKEAA